MHEILLRTKLFIPPPRPNIVPRPRLIEQLNQMIGHKLTLISAPAGFGKTTLVSEWINDLRDTKDEIRITNYKLRNTSYDEINESIKTNPIVNRKSQIENHVAWLSLDKGDNDLNRFLTYLMAALQTAAPSIGEMTILQSPQPPPTQAILTALLNEITTYLASSGPGLVLVLDDYHLIETKAIDEALIFFIDHMPPQMYLVITTREDPPFPLARYRARGQMNELRAADLRFTPEEAAAFLNAAMGLNLTADDAAALERRTEGWIAGLQLAALSLQGREDRSGFIAAFSGDDRYIVDYLVEEVLQNQSAQVREFLLQTSILDRLSGPLCDALTLQDDGRKMLEILERSNLFVIPLDNRRRWYRYHHLFADMLQARLIKEQPDRALHERASAWFEQNDLPSDAIRHALAAEDFARAARLIELTWPEMRRSRREATTLLWMKELPEELFRLSPGLNMGYAWALLDGGELNTAEARLREVERSLNNPAAVVANPKLVRSLPAMIANARAYRAQALGDIPGTVNFTRQALDLLPEDDFYERGTTAALLGLAYWASGDLEAACRSFADGLDSFRQGGHFLIAIGATFILAEMKKAQGQLQAAFKTYEESVKLAAAQGEPVIQGTAELHLGLSELYCERGHLEASRQQLRLGMSLREQASLPGPEYLWHVAQARIKAAEGDLAGELGQLQQAERLYFRTPIPDVQPVAAQKVRVWVRQNRWSEAVDWVQERKVSVDDELSYLKEYEHITLARVLIGRYRDEGTATTIRDALRLLERLRQAAEEAKRGGSLIEILTLQALALQAKGDLAAALVPLERALTLAEPEGYVRLFVNEGPPMGRLLREAAGRGITPTYTAKLLDAFDSGSRSQVILSSQSLTEPLTERELDVLRLFQTELTGPEIARELVIALSTVRTHTKSIYGKLNVNNRRAAVKRAAGLGLI